MSEAGSAEWVNVTLGQLAKGFRGVSYRPENLLGHASESTVTLLRATNIQEGNLTFDDVQFVPSWLVASTQILEVGDIAVCMSNGSKALVGKSAPYRRKEQTVYTVGAFCSIFKPVEKDSAEFVFHLFRSQTYKNNIDVLLAGSAINNLKNSSIESVVFKVPVDKKLRQKIASILTSIDTAIEKTEALIAKYQQIKAGLMHDLFTRGVTADGKLRPPRKQAPELYQEMPIGWIPKEWAVVGLDQACQHIVDCPHSTPNFVPAGVLVARTMHIKDGIFLEDIASRVSEMEYRERVARLMPMAGDVVFTREAPVGEAFVIPHGIRICLGQRVMLIRPKASVLDSDYLVAQIYSGSLSLRISELTAGTTNPHLNVADVRNLAIAVPSFPEQTSMTKRIKAINAHIQQQRDSLEKLRLQKLGLMSDLLTGKVRVKPESKTPELAGG